VRRGATESVPRCNNTRLQREAEHAEIVAESSTQENGRATFVNRGIRRHEAAGTLTTPTYQISYPKASTKLAYALKNFLHI
jgi:hypothetical protein